jgi:hypothetical protein
MISPTTIPITGRTSAPGKKLAPRTMRIAPEIPKPTRDGKKIMKSGLIGLCSGPLARAESVIKKAARIMYPVPTATFPSNIP